jgi:hypothetical protein
MAPPPIPFRQQMTAGQKRGRYFIGIGLGFLPVLLSVAIFFGLASGSAAVGPNAPLSAILNVLGFLPCLLGLGGLGFMIYCFTQERLRFIGYGMLTVFVALPVIAAISCIAIISGVGRV